MARVRVHPKKTYHVEGPPDLEEGASAQYVVKDQNGNPGTATGWTSSNPAALNVTGAGMATAGVVTVDTDVELKATVNGVVVA